MVCFQEGPISTSTWQRRVWNRWLEILMVLAALLSRHNPRRPAPHQYRQIMLLDEEQTGTGGRCGGSLEGTMNEDIEPHPKESGTE